jgi:Leucine-rich repeat (LRR) protein
MAAASCSPTQSGLVGWWPGDGNANNVLGTNNGTLQGGATVDAVGVVGSAFNFDGTNNYVQVPDSAILKPTNLTVEAWVRFTGLESAGNAPAGVQYIVFKQNSRSGNFEGFSLVKERVAGSDYFTFQVTSAAAVGVDVSSSTLISTGVWYHVAAVRGSNFIQLFVNGQLERQTNVAFAQDYGVLPMYFGTTGQSFWDRKFKGTLDEVSLYSRALSSNEVAAIYAAGAEGKCKGANIAVAPQSQSVVMGSNAVFNVTATGFGALSHQWHFNGTNLTGATGTSLTVNSVQPTNAGNYTVVVTNTLGAATSAVAVLTVLIPPAITVPPQSRTNVAGTDASFTVTAIGTAPLSYQWRFGATNILGATATNYTRTSVQSADAGTYTVVVTNAAGAVTSAVASLVVKSPPVLPTQTNRTVAELTLLSVTNTAIPQGGSGSGLTYTLPAAPANATISINGVITWTPTEGQGPATNIITTVVTDNDGLSATNSFTVIVTEVNVAPVLGVQTNRTIAELTLLTVTNPATDDDSPPNTLSYSLLVAPSGATINTNTGVITWIPTEAQGPSLSNAFTTRVLDDGVPALSATNTFYVTVTEVNLAPMLGVQTNRTIAELTILTVANAAADGDLPANALTYSLLAAPSGATINTNTGAISWVPTEAQGPSVSNAFTTRVLDDGVPALSATNTFYVTVTEANLPPVANNDSYSLAMNQAWSVSAPGVLANDTDADLPANTLSAVLVSSPANGTLTLTNNGGFRYLPANNFAGTDTFTYRANDGQDNSGITTVTLTVFSSSSLPFTDDFTRGSDPGPLAPWAINTGNWSVTAGELRGRPNAPSAGYGFAYVSNNWTDCAVSGRIRFDPGSFGGGIGGRLNPVTGEHYAVWVYPEGSPGGANGLRLVKFTSWTAFTQLDVTVELAAVGPDWHDLKLAFHGSQIAAYFDTNLVLSVTDPSPYPSGGISADMWTDVVPHVLSVDDVLVAALAADDSYALSAGTPLTVASPGVLGNDTTVTGDTLNAISVGGPIHGNLTLTNNGGFTYTPTNGYTGPDQFAYTLWEGGTNLGTATVTLSVTPANQPPAIAAPPQSRTNAVGTTASFGVTATGSAPLSYQWRFIPQSGIIPQIVSGATAPNLTLNNVQTSNAGNYTVVVTNNVGVVTSTPPATLTVFVPKLLPDPNLSNAVYFALGKTDETLTALDLAALTNLYADFRNITNLSGLEQATNLTRLTLSGNVITDLVPLQTLRQLITLELENKDHEPLANLTPLAALTNLTSLVLGGTPLFDLSALSSLGNLTTLSVPRSSLTNLSGVQTLSRLTALALYDNQVSDIFPLVALTNLTQLDLRLNPVTNYSLLASFTNLNRLCGGWNYAVTNVSFLQNLRQLNWLDIGYSGVSNLLPLGNLTNLTYLVLSGNPATNYSVLSNLTALVNLELHGNAIIPQSGIAVLTNFHRLAYADLFQSVTNLSPLASLTNLSSLVLSGVSNYTSLTNLNLANLWLSASAISPANGGTAFFTNLTQLRHLDLSDNFIADPLPLRALTNLTGLGLSRNSGLSYAGLAGFTNLTSLLMDGGTVTNLDFLSSLTRLDFLSLRRNRLNTLTGLAGLTNLVSFYADRNRLTNFVALGNLPRLRFVGLTGNSPDASSLTMINELKGRGAQVEHLPTNQPPSLAIAARWIIPMNVSSVLEFSLWDEYTPNDQLLVTANSSNPALLPNANLALGSTNHNRTLTVTPVSNQTGAATLTLIATDEAGTSTAGSVQVEVVPPISISVLCPNLDANLLSAISLASGTPEAELTLVDLLRLEYLSVNNANLTNTCVWSWTTNLTSLYLSSNAVPNLNFLALLPKLTYLGLHNNTATDLSLLAGFTHLDTLVSSGNSFSNLTFLQSFVGLRNLILDDNQITALAPLSGLTNLDLLSLNRNLLTQVGDLINLPQLSFLDLRYNLLDLTNGSPARAVISYLTNGGTTVLFSPQWEPPVIDVRTNWVVNANAIASAPFTAVYGDAKGGAVQVGAASLNPTLVPAASAAVNPAGFGTLMVAAADQVAGTTLVTLHATNEVGLHTSVGIAVTVTVFMPVNGQLLNSTNLTWTGSGNALWFGQSLVTHDGVSAAQSGTIGDNEQSSLETTVTGPGLLTYWRKISSETNYDYLELYVNGELQPNRISGEVNWERQVVTVPAGNQLLRWLYRKDKDSSFGADATWVDEVSFVPMTWLELTRGPSNSFPMQLTLHVTPGEYYQILHSTNLADWLTNGPILATSSEMLLADTNALSTRRFYRLRNLGPLLP